jgi:hypothetical protein
VIAGLIVVVTGFIGVRSQRPGPYWVQFAVGAWLIAAPILLRFENVNPAVIDMLVCFFVAMGGLIAALWLTPNLRRRLPGV